MLFSLHRLVRRGELGAVESLLGAFRPESEPAPGVNDYDSTGCSPLMVAARSARASVEMLRLLLAHGADPNQTTRPSEHGSPQTVLALTIMADNVPKVRCLLEHGADARYRDESNYTATVNAAYRCHGLRLEEQISLLTMLIAGGAELDTPSKYGESAVRILSEYGRFEALRVLLDAGADPGPARWTALQRAVALGPLAEVERELAGGASAEEKDRFGRTALLLAVHAGDVIKARFLLDHGADRQARGPGEESPFQYAIKGRSLPMLDFLLGLDLPAEDRDNALWDAASENDLAAIEALLRAGAKVQDGGEESPLESASNRACILRLLAAGANPVHFSSEGRRAVLGFSPEPDPDLLDVTPEQFEAAKTRRFGTRNPEEATDSFREGMIRSGIDGYQASQLFGGREELDAPPIWCAQRFGQSITFLPDGRIVQTAGEHEDHYDPDFCIYNDVFVHDPDGKITVFEYPKEVFPPTDFHTATLLNGSIYLVGSLGYGGERRFGTTPIYRLETRTFRIERVDSAGDAPGWIFKHRAVVESPEEIRVSGGKLATWDGQKEVHVPNEDTFVFHVGRGIWTRLE